MPASSAAKGEIVTHHDVARADACRNHVRDEGGRLTRCEGAVEAGDVEKLDTECGEVAGLEAKGSEPEGLVRGAEDLARVRLEGEHRQRHAKGTGQAPALFDDRAVAQMDTVEVADGDNSASRVRGRGLPVPNDAHGRAFPCIQAAGE